MERNRLTITTESRILGDEYVRFGGEYIETCSPKKREQGALCLAIEPRRLRGHNGSNAVGDECNNDGGYSEHMVL